MLDDPRHWPDGAGLYCAMNAGDLTENHARFQIQPFTNDHGDIEALGLNILGLRFALLLQTPDFSKYSMLREAKYRLGRIIISYPASTKWITMSWDDGNAHDHMTVKWLHRLQP